ncbi:MAG: S8 family serine peptidase [Bacillota bacterium]|jgi:uncharacterized repeat protein (TIGR02543 family)
MKAISRMLLMLLATAICLGVATPAVTTLAFAGSAISGPESVALKISDSMVATPATSTVAFATQGLSSDLPEASGKGNGYIIRLKDNVPARFSLFTAMERGPVPVAFAEGFYTVESLEDIRDLLDAGLVEYAGPNAELELLDTTPGDPLTNDPLVAQQWYLDLIEAAGAWEAGLTGEGVTVAVIDSGIYREHEDLNYGLIGGYSFLGLPENFASYDDRTGHGTFVTGILASQGNNEKGLAGLTDHVNILSLRCFSSDGNGDYNSGSGMVSTVLSAIGYAMEQNVDVINMSFGGTNEAALLPLAEKLQEASEQGIILVAAAGNGGSSTLYYPAAFDCVVGVGMVDESGNIDPKSQRNSSVFVTAPGSGVSGLGCTATRPYVTGTGTSYAASMVSAMAVIVKQTDAAIDGGSFRTLLRDSSEDRGDAGYDTSYGYGLVNIGRLVQALSKPYAINYDCGYGSLDGEEGTDYPVSYTVDRSSAVTLPVPIRDGYTFGGWYDNPSCTGTALTIVPPGSVGDLTYYAKWFNKADSALSGVTVLGVSAVTDNSDDTGMTYVAELPHGTDLTAITAEDIKAVPANGETAVVEPVPESGGAAWIVTFEAGTGIVEYTIRFIVSKNAAPLVADGQEFQSDSAAPSSYDGKTPAVPYVAIVSGWFTDDGDALTYSVSSVTGSGTAETDGDSLTYTPGISDAGTQVTLVIRANDGQFDSAQVVTIHIDVGRLPVSDSGIEPVTASFDKAGASEEGLRVTLNLFGNTLLSLKSGYSVLEEGTDYVFSGLPVVEGGNGELTLYPAYLASLAEGLHNILFVFSDGRDDASKTVTLALSVVDSTPKYSVRFLTGGTEYHRVEAVRQGDTVTLPTPPAKSGYTFGGWYTEEDGNGTKVTGSTPVTGDLGPVDGTVTLHAKWTVIGGGGGSGGNGGGGAGPVPPEPKPEPPLVLLWENPFQDVSADSWYYSSVEVVCANGLFVGVSDHSFQPEESMTRAMLVTVLHRLAGKPPGTGTSFADVPENSWYTDAVLWAEGEGIVTGYESGFRPVDSITREQLVTMLFRYATTAGISIDGRRKGLSGFVDRGSISPWADEAMEWAVATGLIDGKPGNRLDPQSVATRAEVAAILQRFTENLPDNSWSQF